MVPTQGADSGQHVYIVATVPMAMRTPWLLSKNVKYTNLRRAPGALPTWDTEVGVSLTSSSYRTNTWCPVRMNMPQDSRTVHIRKRS